MRKSDSEKPAPGLNRNGLDMGCASLTGEPAQSTAEPNELQRPTEGRAVTCATIAKGARAEVRVSLSMFKGRQLVDVRAYAPISAAQVMSPTKSGVSLAIEDLAALRAGLEEAELMALALGLIGGQQ